MTRKAGRRAGLLAILTTLALVLTSAPAFAAGPGSGGGGGGGKGGGQGGGGGETTVPNNLSAPTIFIGTGGPQLNLDCSATAADPTGTPLTNYPIDSAAYYYVQGIQKWQASCYTGTGYTTANAYVAWGDNLTGDASLRTNTPIRVEVGLLQGSFDTVKNAVVPTVTGGGYTVEKLDPNALDRDSAYGTLATQVSGVWGPAAKADPFPETRVWVSGAAWKIYNKDTGASAFSGAATAEINATGRVVYGYNLTVTTAGTYVIEFTVPANTVTYTGHDGGTAGTLSGTTASLEITVAANAGGGGGSGGGGGRG